MDPLKVLTVSLRVGKKNRATIISGLKCQWDSGSTDIMINRQHTKPYKCRMISNKVEHSMATGPYCTTHDVNVSFFMKEFSISKIISHRFYNDNYKYESGIGCDTIIFRDLMVNIDLMAYFKRKVLQWGGAAMPMKKPSSISSPNRLNRLQNT